MGIELYIKRIEKIPYLEKPLLDIRSVRTDVSGKHS